MRVPGEAPDGICDPHINLYDCAASDKARYVAIGCLVTVSFALLLGVSTIVFRVKHGQLRNPLRRYGNKWLPSPMDTLLIVLTAYNVLRVIQYITLLLDVPRTLMYRRAVHMLAVVLPFLAMSLFVSGIISQIPSVMTSDRLTNRKGIRISLWVPGPNALFWITTVYCTQLMLVNVGIGATAGFGRDTDRLSLADTFAWIENITMAASILFLLLVACYYCLAFYRILYAYVHRGYAIGAQEDEESKKAARRFRNVFLAVIGVLLVAFLFAVLHAVLSDQLDHNVTVFMAVYIFEYVFFYQLIQMTIMYNLLQSSLASVRRTTSGMAGSRTAASRTNGKLRGPLGSHMQSRKTQAVDGQAELGETTYPGYIPYSTDRTALTDYYQMDTVDDADDYARELPAITFEETDNRNSVYHAQDYVSRTT